MTTSQQVADIKAIAEKLSESIGHEVTALIHTGSGRQYATLALYSSKHVELATIRLALAEHSGWWVVIHDPLGGATGDVYNLALKAVETYYTPPPN